MKYHSLLFIFLFFLFSSCTIEDEFTELTSYDDILVETSVYFKDTAVDYDINFEYYKTDGYNNLETRNMSFSGSTNNGKEIFRQVYKRYRKAGVKIDPVENVDHITITFYEIYYWMDPYFQYRHNSPNGFTLMYDFSTDTYEVTEE